MSFIGRRTRLELVLLVLVALLVRALCCCAECTPTPPN